MTGFIDNSAIQTFKIKQHFNSNFVTSTKDGGFNSDSDDEDIDIEVVDDLDNSKNFFNSLKVTLVSLIELAYKDLEAPLPSEIIDEARTNELTFKVIMDGLRHTYFNEMDDFDPEDFYELDNPRKMSMISQKCEFNGDFIEEYLLDLPAVKALLPNNDTSEEQEINFFQGALIDAPSIEDKRENLSIFVQFFIGYLNFYCNKNKIGSKFEQNFGQIIEDAQLDLLEELEAILISSAETENGLLIALKEFFKENSDEFGLEDAFFNGEGGQKPHWEIVLEVCAEKFMYFLSQPGHGTKDEFLLIDEDYPGAWKQDGAQICVNVETKDLTPVKVSGEYSTEISLNKTFDDFIRCTMLMEPNGESFPSGSYDAEGIFELLKMIDIQSLERNLNPSSDISLFGKLVSALLLDYKEVDNSNLFDMLSKIKLSSLPVYELNLFKNSIIIPGIHLYDNSMGECIVGGPDDELDCDQRLKVYSGFLDNCLLLNPPVLTKNNVGQRAIKSAVLSGNFNIATLLISTCKHLDKKEIISILGNILNDASKDIPKSYDDFKKLLEFCLSFDTSVIDFRDKIGETALAHAAFDGNDKLVKLLLESGASHRISSEGYSDHSAHCNGYTPLHWVCSKPTLLNTQKGMSCLLELISGGAWLTVLSSRLKSPLDVLLSKATSTTISNIFKEIMET